MPAPLAAIRPTFLPGGAPRATVVTLRPPFLLLPWGCAAATMALPRVRGYLWPFAFFMWCFSPAFRNGFSWRPAADTMPIVARHESLMYFVFPEGNFIMVPWGVWATRVAYVPEERAIFPPSPGESSMPKIMVPSGMLPSGRMLPISIGAWLPIWIFWPW